MDRQRMTHKRTLPGSSTILVPGHYHPLARLAPESELVRILNYPRLLAVIGLCGLGNLAGLSADIGNLSFISFALAQHAALTTSQSDALNAYNKTVQDALVVDGRLIRLFTVYTISVVLALPQLIPQSLFSKYDPPAYEVNCGRMNMMKKAKSKVQVKGKNAEPGESAQVFEAREARSVQEMFGSF